MTAQTDILIEPLSEGRIRVSGFERLSAEGTTLDEAIRRFRQKIEDDLAPSVEVATITLEVPGNAGRLARLSERWSDDSLLDEWDEAVEERRKRVDAELEASFEALQAAEKP